MGTRTVSIIILALFISSFFIVSSSAIKKPEVKIYKHTDGKMSINWDAYKHVCLDQCMKEKNFPDCKSTMENISSNFKWLNHPNKNTQKAFVKHVQKQLKDNKVTKKWIMHYAWQRIRKACPRWHTAAPKTLRFNFKYK